MSKKRQTPQKQIDDLRKSLSDTVDHLNKLIDVADDKFKALSVVLRQIIYALEELECRVYRPNVFLRIWHWMSASWKRCFAQGE